MASQDPPLPDREELLARRLLGLDAGYSVIVGLGLGVAGGTLARSMRLPSWAVRGLGLATVGWGVGVGVASWAEEWEAPTRTVAITNIAATSGLVGLAATRGSLSGRLTTLALAGSIAAFAYGQVRALARERGPIIA